MPYQAVELRPGIDVERTPVLNATGWAKSQAIRFFEGLPQKVGGWFHLNNTTLTGFGRGMTAWADNSNIPYIAVGTNQFLELFLAGDLLNITPLRKTINASPNMSTDGSTANVTITDTAHGASAGDWIQVVVPVSVGGVVVQGYYRIASVTDANNYVIVASTVSTSVVNNGGAVPNFATTNGSADVVVTLANHGLVVGNTFTVQVSTTVGNIIFLGVYSVVAPVATNTFHITGANVANATTNGNENGGNMRIQYLIPSGPDSAFFAAQGGYGQGNYGGGAYGGSSTASILTQLRYWTLGHFGQDLFAAYNGSPIYIWVPPYVTGATALQLNATNFPSATDPPTAVNFVFGSATQQMIIALGCDPVGGGAQDPNLVRWCDVGDFTDWFPTTTNQAGSFRIPSGSTLIGGISTANFNVLWTDIDMWVMSYLGGELVWGFQKVADAVDLIGPLAAGVFRSSVYWPSSNGFYVYDGASVQQIPCPVWDIFWFNLNRTQAFKVNAQVNSYFQEISWGFASASGNGEVDSRITYNIRENSWSYDIPPTPLARTCWIDDNVYNAAPTGTDLNGYIQEHESTNDADGQPLPSSIQSGWFALSESEDLMFVERLIADLIVTGGTQTVYILVETQNYPTGPIIAYGPFTWTSGSTGPPYSIVRSRGRMARITVSSTAQGVFWRLGRIRYLGQPSGRGN